MTADLLSWARPAIGELLTARASVVHAGKRQAVVRCEVVCGVEGEEKLCAVAQGTISKVEPRT